MSTGATVSQYIGRPVQPNATGTENQGFLTHLAKTTPSTTQPENVYYDLTDLPIP